jgi:AcrR family transcriptional regulator
VRTQPTRKKGLRAETGVRAAQVALRREQLLVEALGLFSERGYAGTSTKQIAAAAGVTEGLVFHHFGSKEALLVELLGRGTSFAGKVFALVERGSAASARALLLEVAQAYAEATSEERRLVTFVTAEAQVNPLLRGPVAAGHVVMIQRFATLLEGHVARGELREGADLAAAVTGFFGGFSFFFGLHRELSDAAWREQAATFARAWAETCWRGLASPGSLSVRSTKKSR